MRFVVAFACAAVLTCLGVLSSHAEKRVALVIGNDSYVNLPAHQQLRKATGAPATCRSAATRGRHIGWLLVSGVIALALIGL
jgi:hypothetical protein